MKTPEHANKRGLNFIRWSGINIEKQKGYKVETDENTTFHEPPARYGIYAFVWPYFDLFLVSKREFDPRRMLWLKDKNGKKIDSFSYDWDSNYDNGSHYFSAYQNTKGKRYSERDAGKIYNKEKELKEYVDKGIITDSESTDLFVYWRDKHTHQYVAYYKKPTKFTHNGKIWHHLTDHAKSKDILKRHGSWILSDMENYKKLLSKTLGGLTKEASRCKDWQPVISPRFSCLDFLEVFIEKII